MAKAEVKVEDVKVEDMEVEEMAMDSRIVVAVSADSSTVSVKSISQPPVTLAEDSTKHLVFKTIQESSACNDWLNLGRELGLKEPQIDAIGRNLPGQIQEQCYQMLEKWHKDQFTRDTNPDVLVTALESIGCKRVAEDIRECLNTGTFQRPTAVAVSTDPFPARSQSSSQLPVTLAEDPTKRRVFKIIQESSACTNWRDLGRQLGVAEPHMDAIDRNLPGQIQEQCYQMLENWHKNQLSGDTNPSILMSALECIGCKRVAGEIEDCLIKESFHYKGAVAVSTDLSPARVQSISQPPITLAEDSTKRLVFKTIQESSACNNWLNLGRELGLKDAQIDAIGRNLPGQLQEQCYQMLEIWLKDQLTRDTSPGVLMVALERIGCKRVAEEIKRCLIKKPFHVKPVQEN